MSTVTEKLKNYLKNYDALWGGIMMPFIMENTYLKQTTLFGWHANVVNGLK